MSVVGLRIIGKDQYVVSANDGKLFYRKVGSEKPYEVSLGSSGIPQCTCKGFVYNGKCKHVTDYEDLAPKIVDKLPQREVEEVVVEPGRIARADLEEHVEAILDMFTGHGHIIEAAGSWRRGKPTIGDLDFVTTAGPEDIYEICGGGDLVTASGTKVIRFGIDLGSATVQVDFALTSVDFFGACLMYLTGSKEFNIKTRQRAKSMGMKLSRNGLEIKESSVIVAKTHEGDIFRGLNLEFIPPSCREEDRWGDYGL